MAGSLNNKAMALSVLAAVLVACFSVGVEMADAKQCSGSVSDAAFPNAVVNILTTLARVTPSRPDFTYETTYAGTIRGSASCPVQQVQPCIDCLGRLQSQLSSCTTSSSGSCSEDDCSMSFSKL